MQNQETPTAELVVSKVQTILDEKKITLEKTNLNAIAKSFTPYLIKLADLQKEALACKVTDVSQKKEMQRAKEIRIAIKNIRTAADKDREKLKEQSNMYNNGVQAVYNFIKNECLPLEEHAEQQEKFFEIQETKRKKALADERLAKLKEFNFQFDNGFGLGEMDEPMFNNLLIGVKKAHEDAIETERIANEQAAQKEQLLKLHNFRNQSLMPYWNYVTQPVKMMPNLGVLTEDEFAAVLKNAIAEKTAAYKELQLLKKQKEEAEAKLEKERAAVKKAQSELKAKQDAEEKQKKALAEEAEAKKLADEKAAKKAANAPDKAKLKAMRLEILSLAKSLSLIELKGEEASKILSNTILLFTKVVNYVDKKTEEL